MHALLKVRLDPYSARMSKTCAKHLGMELWTIRK